MPLMFGPGRPRRAGALRAAFDTTGLANPTKVLPSPAGVRRRPRGARGRLDLSRGPRAVRRGGRRATDPVTIAGLGRRGAVRSPGVRCVARAVRDRVDPGRRDDGAVRRRHAGRRARRGAGRARSADACCPAGGTVGGALAVGRSGIRRLGDGSVRDVLLQARYVGADGEVVKAGGPTVKNVSGFDVCRLLVGSRGTLGLPRRGDPADPPDRAALAVVRHVRRDDPMAVFAALYRPVVGAVGRHAVVGAARGSPDDVAEQAAAARARRRATVRRALPPARRRSCAARRSAAARRRPVRRRDRRRRRPRATTRRRAAAAQLADAAPAVAALRDRIKQRVRPDRSAEPRCRRRLSCRSSSSRPARPTRRDADRRARRAAMGRCRRRSCCGSG